VAKKLALEPVFEVGLVARRRNFFESASYGIALSKDWSAPRQLGVLLLELAQPLHLRDLLCFLCPTGPSMQPCPVLYPSICCSSSIGTIQR